MMREDRCQIPQKNSAITSVFPPMDLLYLAAVAENAGCLCRITDYTLGRHTWDDFKRELAEFKPDLLLISATTPTLARDLAACALAKECLPDVVTVAKGAHFLKFSSATLEKFSALDIVIRGEAENVFKEIVSGAELPRIKGISWRSGNGIIDNQEAGFIGNLDALPFPARHLIDNRRYRRPDNGKVQAVIKVGRGCAHNCFFCLATAVSGPAVRLRSPENIIEEIKLCIDRYGIKDFLFFAENFTADKDWVLRLCRQIIASGLKFNWSANSRLDSIDPETAGAMRQAGCTLVSIGIESGNNAILKQIGKNLTLKDILNSFPVFKKAGLKTLTYYIVGFPWDTEQTVKDTIRLSLKLNSDYAAFYTAVPFPGTRFFDYARQNGLLEAGQEEQAYRDAYYCPPAKGHYLSREQIIRLHRQAVREFYLRPEYIIKRFLSIRSLGELYYQARLAFFTAADHCSYLKGQSK